VQRCDLASLYHRGLAKAYLYSSQIFSIRGTQLRFHISAFIVYSTIRYFWRIKTLEHSYRYHLVAVYLNLRLGEVLDIYSAAVDLGYYYVLPIWASVVKCVVEGEQYPELARFLALQLTSGMLIPPMTSIASHTN
jgi:hypothetical protein